MKEVTRFKNYCIYVLGRIVVGETSFRSFGTLVKSYEILKHFGDPVGIEWMKKYDEYRILGEEWEKLDQRAHELRESMNKIEAYLMDQKIPEFKADGFIPKVYEILRKHHSRSRVPLEHMEKLVHEYLADTGVERSKEWLKLYDRLDGLRDEAKRRDAYREKMEDEMEKVGIKMSRLSQR